MKHRIDNKIISIQDIITREHDRGYEGEIAVFVSGKGSEFRFFDGNPVYVNAFTYFMVTGGTAELIADGQAYRIDNNIFGILTPLHLTFFDNISDDFQAIFMPISKSFIDRIADNSVQNRIVQGIRLHSVPVVPVTPGQHLLLMRCIEDIRSCISRTDHRFQLELIQNALVRFYLEIDNILDSGQGDVEQTRYADILKKFIGLLISSYRKEHTVPFYAEALNISPKYLTNIVKRQTGKTVSGFIGEMLFSESKNLLAGTGLSVQQIADTLNFSDQSAFAKFFRRQAGCSPKQYREMMTRL